MDVTGHCHCGSIRFRAAVDPGAVVICHCTQCQNLTGTAYRVSVPALAESFELLSGKPSTYVKSTRANRQQAFCPTCGSHLFTYEQVEDAAARYGLRLGCLDERAQLAPQRQKWCASALPWAMDISQLPSNAGD